MTKSSQDIYMREPEFQPKRLLLLGNGPSLKKEYFELLDDIPTLGMNAAYRYWQTLDWWPSLYCCLDDQVVASHADAIRTMIDEKRCNRFFLHTNFIEWYPNYTNHDRVLFLPQLMPGPTNEGRCRKFGLKHTPSPFFRSTNYQKLTTGAYAVRFAAHEGYHSIGLIGVDCRYVEKLPVTRELEDIALEISETPEENPNYFFSDYQRAGDRYNIPNPIVHEGNLHLQSFEVLKHDNSEFGFDLQLQTCTKESQLFDDGIFPYTPVQSFVYPKALSAVFVPYVDREVPTLIERLHQWGTPECAPNVLPVGEKPRLCFAFNKSRDLGRENLIRVAFEAAELGRYFSQLEFYYSGLEGLSDLYKREFDGSAGPEGYMAGPNNQFFDIITTFSAGCSHVVLVEPDVAPLRPGWLGKLQKTVEDTDRFWICGSHYRGWASVKSFWHINGNAIYNVGDIGFQRFLRDLYFPYFYDRLKQAPTLPYDIALHEFFADFFAMNDNPLADEVWRRCAHLFRYSEVIVNISHDVDRLPSHLLDIGTLRRRFPDCYLVHGAIGLAERDLRKLTRPDASATLLVSLDCDAVDHFGHYLAYDGHIASTAETIGLKVVTVANARLEPEYSQSVPGQVLPLFEFNSWFRSAPHILAFKRDLARALNEVDTLDNAAAIVLYMYCAGLEHAKAVEEVIASRPRVSAVINLFYAVGASETAPAFKEMWGPFLIRAAHSHSLTITVPTDRLAADFQAAFGVKFDVAPHPSTTFGDQHAATLSETGRHALPDRPTILFPGGMRREKGFDLSAQTAAILSNDHDYSCVLRAHKKDDTPEDMVTALDRLDLTGVELFAETLDGDGFKRFIQRGDVIVCPYLAPPFARRTSGLVIDAILLGRPFVAVEGTWLAELATATGAGAVSGPTPEELATTVQSVLNEYSQYTQNIERARRDYLDRNSWKALIDQITASPSKAAQRPRLARRKVQLEYNGLKAGEPGDQAAAFAEKPQGQPTTKDGDRQGRIGEQKISLAVGEPAVPVSKFINDQQRSRRVPARMETATRFLFSGFRGLWRRRIWTLPAALAIIVAVFLAAQIDEPLLQLAAFTIIGFSALSIGILYLGLRLYQYTLVLSAQTAAARREALNRLSTRESALRKELKKVSETSASASRKTDRALADYQDGLRSTQTAVDSLRRRTNDDLSRRMNKLQEDGLNLRQKVQEVVPAFEQRLGEAIQSNLRVENELTARIDQEAQNREWVASEATRSITELSDALKGPFEQLQERFEEYSRASDELQQAVAERTSQMDRLHKDVRTIEDTVRVNEQWSNQTRVRIAASELQLRPVLYGEFPRTLIFFGHHKCASRFFRTTVFERVGEMTGSNIRHYTIEMPPFHYSDMDDLDLANIDFSDLGQEDPDIVLFANATQRSLDKVKAATDDWLGLRVIRDPRQVLVSNYFHHRDGHDTELNGWIWDKLIEDRPVLQELTIEEGLLYELDNISKQVIENQILAPFADERIMTIKLEDFSEDTTDGMWKIAEFLRCPRIAGLDMSPIGRNSASGPWQTHFTSRIRRVFKERYGDALVDLGYADDLDW